MKVNIYIFRLFVFGLVFSNLYGCGKRETIEGNYIEEFGIIEEDSIQNTAGSEEGQEELIIEDEEKKIDRGLKSPLATYAIGQLSGEIKECHEADYDEDGKFEVILSARVDRISKDQLDQLEIYFVDDNYEIVLIDRQNVGEEEDIWDREEIIWCDNGTLLKEYDGKLVFNQVFLSIGSTGSGYYRNVLYGCVEGEPEKLKETEGWGSYGRTTYLCDGSISEVQDGEFVKICEGDFSSVINNSKFSVDEIEEWYKNYDNFQCYEADIDHDGTNELYITNTYVSAVFNKSNQGIECWWLDDSILLLDDGTFLLQEKSLPPIISVQYDKNSIIYFDQSGNQEIQDEYVWIYVIGEEITDKEELIFLKDYYIGQDIKEGQYYYHNGESITEDEYYEQIKLQ